MVDTAFFEIMSKICGKKWFIRLPIFFNKYATETPSGTLDRAQKTVYETVKTYV